MRRPVKKWQSVWPTWKERAVHGGCPPGACQSTGSKMGLPCSLLEWWMLFSNGHDPVFNGAPVWGRYFWFFQKWTNLPCFWPYHTRGCLKCQHSLAALQMYIACQKRRFGSYTPCFAIFFSQHPLPRLHAPGVFVVVEDQYFGPFQPECHASRSAALCAQRYSAYIPFRGHFAQVGVE